MDNDPIAIQRIISTLHLCIQKLHTFSISPPDILQYREDLISSFPPNHCLRQGLIRQGELEHRYEELLIRRNRLKLLENKTKYKIVHDEIQVISRMLKENTKSLYKQLMETPRVKENVSKVKEKTEQVIDILEATVEELGDMGDYPTLKREVEEEDSMREKVEEAKSKEMKMVTAVKKMKDDCHLERENYLRRAGELKKEIDELTEKLLTYRKGWEVENYQTEVTANKNTSLFLLEQEERQLREEIVEMERKIQKENEAHNETINFLNKKISDLENDKLHWEEKYNNDMSRQEMDLAKKSNERDSNLEILVTLKRRREKEIEEEEAVIEAKRIEEVKRKAEKKEEMRLSKAAIAIQRKGREFLRRPKPETSKEKKKVKKGKKKK